MIRPRHPQVLANSDVGGYLYGRMTLRTIALALLVAPLSNSGSVTVVCASWPGPFRPQPREPAASRGCGESGGASWARCLLSAPMPRASAPHPARLTPYPPTLAPHARRLAQCAATLAPYKGRSTQCSPPFTPHQGTFAQLARRVAQYAGTLARRASTFPELAERFVCVA
jgi:hypothetical protein